MTTDVFGTINHIPHAEIVYDFTGLRPNRVGFIFCPFHTDGRTPNYKVYSNGGHCFSCGAHHDNVSFVAALFGIRQIDAARKISDHKHLSLFPDKPLSRMEQRQVNEAIRQRRDDSRVIDSFNEWWNSVSNTLAWYGRYLRMMQERLKPRSEDDEISDDYVFVLHELEKLEQLFDCIEDDNDNRQWIENAIATPYGKAAAQNYLECLIDRQMKFYNQNKGFIAFLENLRNKYA